MYQVEQSEPSQEFKNAWQAAGRFLQSKGDKGLNWIRSNLNLPMVEHLSFRLGNQLFFVFIEAAEFNFQKSSKLFLNVSRKAKADIQFSSSKFVIHYPFGNDQFVF